MPLSLAQEALLNNADANRVAAEFTKLANYWARGRWLGANNRYASDTVAQIKKDVLPAGRVRDGQMASYIAASSVIHCMDGWGYIARAVEAELAGDVDATKHLAYYAELRAAMALLASGGIGVFRTKHFAVTSTGDCTLIAASGTHEFVWDALQHWAQQPAATKILLEVIEPGGVPAAEWLRHFPPAAGAGVQAILAKTWLLEWGLDLQRLAVDRESRNESSYRPTSISSRPIGQIRDSLAFIEDLWRANAPSGTQAFRVLDRHLLRRSLAHAFKLTHARGYYPSRAPAEFARQLGPVLHAVMPTPGDLTEAQWRQFLAFRGGIQENKVVTEAQKTDGASSSSHQLQILARAAILLRIATGAARKTLVAMPSLEDLRFWWHPIGVSKGFWESAHPPADTSELWDDVELSLQSIAAWLAAGNNSRAALYAQASGPVHALAACERVAFWGLGV